ncbi:MAG: FHA domain-containing protein [Deltaproteobacteria bacterium]|nr:FHA domain-containing protein [Deltaproteobacteria bacterium]
MPRLLVRFSATKSLVYSLAPGDTTIGRNDDCTLVLPNLSVSRDHARITVTPERTVIQDLQSQNGILVNGKQVAEHRLKSGDEVQIGKFSLAYLDDRETFYNGRVIQYMMPYSPDALPPHMADSRAEGTMAFNLSALKKMQESTHAQDNARIILMSDPNKFWYPQVKGITFGNGGMVRVDAWFAFGVVAAVTWEGGKHILSQKAFWVPLSCNGKAGTRIPLVHGAKFSIGSTRFRYEVPAFSHDLD